ncbi:hypothetical protein DSL92_03995 [Billgrantia gudaonensis]|uniref:Uncharacterized protein n=1 Tax=Billgrantia gudaonensis TaxID=376427 RepID=A0A3S0NE84_9GAMM|nr:hypothetical protein DSL92_03995 [Halomonas gudaonensis]
MGTSRPGAAGVCGLMLSGSAALAATKAPMSLRWLEHAETSPPVAKPSALPGRTLPAGERYSLGIVDEPGPAVTLPNGSRLLHLDNPLLRRRSLPPPAG